MSSKTYPGSAEHGEALSREPMSGFRALALALRRVKPQLVAVVAGRPLTPTEEDLAATGEAIWVTHEAVATQMALGATASGSTGVAMVKQVGFQVALDTAALGAVHWVGGPCLVIVGDDPGSPGSDIEGDSRVLAANAELPCFEPSSVADIFASVTLALEASAQAQCLAVLRVTRTLMEATEEIDPSVLDGARPVASAADSPASVWQHSPLGQRELHHERLASISSRPGADTVAGNGGDLRIVATGAMAQAALASGLETLVVRRTYPVPDPDLEAFAKASSSPVLVLEEGMPLIERLCRQYATGQVLGRLTGHVPQAGPPDAGAIIAAGETAIGKVRDEPAGDPPRPDDIAGMGRLFEVIDDLGLGPAVCDAGMCGVAPYLIPDVAPLSYGLGSTPGVAAGRAIESGQPTVGVIGDMGYFHTGLAGMAQLVRQQAPVLVVVHDNGVAAYTGGQPHVGSPAAAGEQQISIEKVALGIGVEWARRITTQEANTDLLKEILSAWKGDPVPALLVIEERVDREYEAR